MAIEGVPWMVNGGLHTAEVGRQLAFAATNGATGVTQRDDFKVTALPTPGNSVRLAAGSGSIASKYLGASGQSYIVRAGTATDVPVGASTTSARTLYVILRILDPQYPGQPVPSDPTVGPYVRPEIVSNITNLEVPFLALARLNIPANTATITQAMITDLREVANPREKQIIIPRPLQGADVPAAGYDQLNGASVDGQPFPFYAQGTNQSGNMIKIPEWATRMQIEATWISVRMQPANTDGYGDLWVDFGPVVRAEKLKYSTRIYHWDQTAGDVSRNNWELADEVAVPEELRGQTTGFLMKASRQGAAYPRMDGRSGYKLRVRFIEQGGV